MNPQARHRALIAITTVVALALVGGVIVASLGSRPHQTERGQVAPSTVPITAPAGPSSGNASRLVPVPPLTDHPAQTAVQAEYDAALASGLGSSSGLEVAEAARVPAPAFTAAWPPRPVGNTPAGWAESFTTGLLDIDFARQPRTGLGAWLSAEAAPELLPGVPPGVQGKVLYLSLFDAGALDSTSPIPDPAAWAAHARAGVRWKVSGLLAQTDPQFSQIVASGWQPVDQRFTVEDVSGLLTTTRAGASTRHRFSMAVYVGSARWHPGYGTVLVDDWKET